VEGFVLEQLRALAADAAAWHKALGSTLAQQCILLAEKDAEARTLAQDLARLRAAYRKASPAQRVALQAPKRRVKEQRATLRQQINALQQAPGSDRDRLGSTLAQQRLLLADKEGEARTLDQELTRLRTCGISRADRHLLRDSEIHRSGVNGRW
jgi:hypothetical protein